MRTGSLRCQDHDVGGGFAVARDATGLDIAESLDRRLWRARCDGHGRRHYDRVRVGISRIEEPSRQPADRCGLVCGIRCRFRLQHRQGRGPQRRHLGVQLVELATVLGVLG